MAATTKLSLSGTELLRLSNLDNIAVGANGLEEGNGSTGLGEVWEGRRGDDERNRWGSGDSVTTGEDKRLRSGGGNGGGGSESLLVQVDLDVPSSPDLGRSEHSSGTTHVTKGGLASTVSTTTGDTGNTGNSTTSSPRLGRSLMTGLYADGVGLSLVLCHTGMNSLNDVGTDWALEDIWKWEFGIGLPLSGEDLDLWNAGHCVG